MRGDQGMELILGCTGAPWLILHVRPGFHGGNKQLCPVKELCLA